MFLTQIRIQYVQPFCGHPSLTTCMLLFTAIHLLPLGRQTLANKWRRIVRQFAKQARRGDGGRSRTFTAARVLALCPAALRRVTKEAPAFRRACLGPTLPSFRRISGFPFVGATRSTPQIQQQERAPSSMDERMASDGTASSSVMVTGKVQRTPFLADPAQLIASVETFVFDCDGVIWKGNKLMDKVGETMDLLRALGKRIFFLTNNSTKSRKQYGRKCESLGLNVREEEVFSSGFAAVEYLKSINYPANKKVYVISEAGVQMELEQAGFQWLGGPDDDDKKIDAGPGKRMEHDPDVGAVVVGFDRHVNYYKIQYATLCLRENPGCLFIASNCDDIVQLNDAQCWAGEGAIVGAIKGATNRDPIVAGKPSTFMMDYLVEKFKISSSQICMVGDKLDTDILFGHNGGCKTLLVLSGVTDLETLQSPDNDILPDCYTDKVSDLLAANQGSCTLSCNPT